jgi:N-acetylneuraminic acid mutarotase
VKFAIGWMAMTVVAMAQTVEWRELPALPQPLGGQFVGVIGDSLVVAGGSFWDGTPWDGGTKKWSDAIFVLARGEAKWRHAGRLPEASGYGVAVNTPEGMLCLGGQTAADASAHVYLLRMAGDKVTASKLADLPQKRMTMSGAVLGGKVYLAGGQPSATPTVALHKMWSAPLEALVRGGAKWTEVEPWPGPGRFMAQMAALDGSLYLAGGSDLAGQPPTRAFLSDAYAYDPGKGWRKLTDLPVRAQAGFGASRGGEFLVMGGSDGELAAREAEVREKHPGFSRTVWAYNPAQK